MFKTPIVALTLATLSITLFSCDDDDDAVVTPAPSTPTYSATINMKQMVEGNTLMMNTMNLPYTNAAGQKYKVTKVQYLISDIRFNKSDGSSFLIDEYHYVDLNDTSTLTFQPTTKVPKADYSSISFTFGFDENDNVDGQYSDLNIKSWQWPSDPNSMPGDLGGGYHFMRLEGNFEDSTGNSTAEFKTHMGRARDLSTNPVSYLNNHFVAMPSNSAISISTDFSFDIVMNIEKWYDAPFQWDFDTWNFPVMGNFNAQRALNQNGPTVFTIDIP